MLLSDDNPALAAARQLFAENQLQFPPIPDHLAHLVQQQAPWVFGTRPQSIGLYDLPGFVAEYLAQPPEYYCLFGHAGHGLNSWAMHYYLVDGPLAVFTQTLWGGVYTDSIDATAVMGARFGHAEDLLAAVAEARRFQYFPADRRLVVVQSDLHPTRWGWRAADGAIDWHAAPHALIAAAEAVEALNPSGLPHDR